MAKCSLPDFQLIITCEHASNSVPEEYEAMIDPALLVTHRGYDIGAFGVAKNIAETFGAPFLFHDVTRLLVDVNRSASSQTLFAYKWPVDVRQEILEKYYLPYRHKVHELIDETIQTSKMVLHLSIHSFTPILDDVVRDCDVGLLYDPARSFEMTVCQKLAEGLKACSPLNVRMNYPYQGTDDGLVTTLRKTFQEEQYVGIEIECNQKLLIGYRDEIGAPLKFALERLF